MSHHSQLGALRSLWAGLALKLFVLGPGRRVVDSVQLALLLAVVPAQTLVQRVEPVGDLVGRADGRHREHGRGHAQTAERAQPVRGRVTGRSHSLIRNSELTNVVREAHYNERCHTSVMEVTALDTNEM